MGLTTLHGKTRLEVLRFLTTFKFTILMHMVCYVYFMHRKKSFHLENISLPLPNLGLSLPSYLFSFPLSVTMCSSSSSCVSGAIEDKLGCTQCPCPQTHKSTCWGGLKDLSMKIALTNNALHLLMEAKHEHCGSMQGLTRWETVPY